MRRWSARCDLVLGLADDLGRHPQGLFLLSAQTQLEDLSYPAGTNDRRQTQAYLTLAVPPVADEARHGQDRPLVPNDRFDDAHQRHRHRVVRGPLLFNDRVRGVASLSKDPLTIFRLERDPSS